MSVQVAVQCQRLHIVKLKLECSGQNKKVKGKQADLSYLDRWNPLGRSPEVDVNAHQHQHLLE
jgi:hypothetical protein